MAIVGEKTTLKLVGVGALDDPPVNKTISPINQNLKGETQKANSNEFAFLSILLFFSKCFTVRNENYRTKLICSINRCSNICKCVKRFLVWMSV